MTFSGFLIKLFSKYVGQDDFGNTYYKSGKKRFVIYNGYDEPTKVEPMWHAWLHNLSEQAPNAASSSLNKVLNPGLALNSVLNFTGTQKAYKPRRVLVSSDYSPWKP